jgi:hypothetical protein
MFRDCQTISGVIPKKLFSKTDDAGLYISNGISRAAGVFYDCVGISGKIPSDIFTGFSSVLSLNSFFQGCRGLVGGIPKELFKDCKELAELQYFLAMTNNSHVGGADKNQMFAIRDHAAENTFINDEYYSLDPDIFKHNTKLMNLQGIFYRCVLGDYQLPPTLFRGTELYEKVPVIGDDGEIVDWVDEFKGYSGFPSLQNTAEMFFDGSVDVELDGELFKYVPNIQNVSKMFMSTYGRINLHSNFLIPENGKYKMLKNFRQMFGYLGSLPVPRDMVIGTAPDWWNYPYYTSAEKTECFSRCDQLTNYDSINIGWK